MPGRKGWALLLKRLEELAVFCGKHNIIIEKPALLARYCTFKIGGEAGMLAQPSTAAQAALLLGEAKGLGVPVLPLGKGSNVLFGDEGFSGLVIHFGASFSHMELREGERIYCQSGASLTQLCHFAWQNGLTGLEFAYGIPGSVGGAIYMNAGAYGGELKDVLAKSFHIAGNGQEGILEGAAMELSYRHSAYTNMDALITGGEFALQKGSRDDIRARMDDVMGRRKEKQPLEYPSAGSTFKRPPGAFAAALIDECGLKGRRVGGAMVSEKHAGFVINYDNATCRDVQELIRQVQDEVFRRTGYRLECEVRLIEG